MAHSHRRVLSGELMESARLTPPSSPSLPRMSSIFDDSLSSSDKHPTFRPSSNITLPGINTIMKATPMEPLPLSSSIAPPTPLSAILPPLPLASSSSSLHGHNATQYPIRLPSIDTFTALVQDSNQGQRQSQNRNQIRNDNPSFSASPSPPPITSNESSPATSPRQANKSSRPFKPRSRGKPHTCPVCGRIFYRISNLNTHIVTHTGDKKHVCDFIIEPDHIDYSRHSSRSGSVSGSGSGGLVWQNTSPGFTSVLPLPGSPSSSSSPSSSPLVTTTDSPLQPRRCNQRFARIYDLERHKRCHTRQLPYACALCPEQFIRNDPLWRHYKKVHPNDPRVPERKQVQYARKAALSLPVKASLSDTEQQAKQELRRSLLESSGGGGSELDEAMVNSTEALSMTTTTTTTTTTTMTRRQGGEEAVVVVVAVTKVDLGPAGARDKSETLVAT
ncbi:hypothetical protein BG003_000142 [Podila horticola]|nr:hypothetical protein BG003_000142 [Podila horticola]